MSRKLLVILLLGLLAIHHVSAVDIATRLRSKLKLSEAGEESGDDEGSEESGSDEESSNDEGSEESSDSEESSEGGGKAISATRLQAQESGESGESSCDKKPACQQQPQYNDEENNKPQKVDPEELVKPIDDWIKGFKKRTSGGGGGNDLYDNAKATVKPLIDKLRRNQEQAQEKLKEANENILAHVQDATTEHVYKLLKASKKSDDKAEKKEQKKEVAEEKSEEQEEKKEDSELAKKVASEASESAKAAQEISENADAIKQVAAKAAQKAS